MISAAHANPGGKEGGRGMGWTMEAHVGCNLKARRHPPWVPVHDEGRRASGRRGSGEEGSLVGRKWMWYALFDKMPVSACAEFE